MKLTDAIAFRNIIKAAINKAIADGHDEVDLVISAQAMDDQAREELESAIEEAEQKR